MPHTPQEKKKAITRLRRIRGQAEALERAIENEAECSAILQQVAAMRGAVSGLMGEILESHLRENISPPDREQQRKIEETLALIRSYMK